MSQWGIGRRLFVGIGVLVALILASGGIAIWAGSQMKKQLDHTARETARTRWRRRDLSGVFTQPRSITKASHME